MKKKLFFSFLFICLTILAFGAISASAATYGDLTYSVSNGEVTITDCNTTATEVNIPEKINGYPVTSIGDSAFAGCTSLATITIPINNANGDVAQLKAFVWESFTSMTPVGAPAVFPTE